MIFDISIPPADTILFPGAGPPAAERVAGQPSRRGGGRGTAAESAHRAHEHGAVLPLRGELVHEQRRASTQKQRRGEEGFPGKGAPVLR